jgi:methionyl aminopeptidase
MIVNIKSDEEIKGFKRAGRIAGSILSTLLKEVKVGTTGEYLDKLAKRECKRHEVTPTFLGYKNYPSAICVSVNNTLVHGIPNDTELKENDVVSIDIGITTIEGYIGDTAKTVALGKIPEFVGACEAALYKSISVAKTGNNLSKISEEIFNHSKLSKCSIPNDYGGHGIDRYILHSSPFIPSVPDYESDFILRPGMVLAIEPMFILGHDSKLGVLNNKWDVVCHNKTAHFEHTILITDRDPYILTRSEDE